MRMCVIYHYELDFVALFMRDGELHFRGYSLMADDSRKFYPELDLRYDEEEERIITDSPAPDNYSAWVDWAVAQYSKGLFVDIEGYTLIDHYWR